MVFIPPFKSPYLSSHVSTNSNRRPIRIAATGCKEKLALGLSEDLDEKDYSTSPNSSPIGRSGFSGEAGSIGLQSKNSALTKRSGDHITNIRITAAKKANLSTSTNIQNLGSKTHGSIYTKSVKKVFRPFIPPYADPKKRAEHFSDSSHHAALGMRPLFNIKNLMKPRHDPDVENAIVLYRPSKTLTESEKLSLSSKIIAALNKNPGDKKDIPEVAVVVDPKLGNVLRPHQVEGVKFLYNCVTGREVEGAYGCIMADEMGLGKTLQCIALLWTLIKQSPTPLKPTAERVIIACPSSLVKNWANELVKWLGKGKINPITCDHKATTLNTSKQQLKLDLRRFLGPSRRNGGNEVLIISYETLRANVGELGKQHIGLLLCDEGHRLKNSAAQTYTALNELNVARRVILTGTPIQNDLSEYFSLLNFANPNLLGTPNEFRRNYENRILRGRDADATEHERKIGDEKLQELNALVSKFIIRRTNDLLTKYLPTKYEHVVFCKLSKPQQDLYESVLESKSIKKLLSGQDSQTFKSITLLRKLTNHPLLLNLPGDIKGSEMILPELAVEKSYATSRAYRSSVRDGQTDPVRVELSGKLLLLDRMLARIKSRTDDKVVLISNFTQTLDLFARLCQYRSYSCLRLDGTMSTAKRQKLVDRFNDPEGTDFIFLLSSKAGGCGINLIGANRLVLFDPDWNPASDQQALARVWRDGQKKVCFIYRLIASGTIEEKILQRQAHKQTLSSCVIDEEENLERHFSLDNLKKLFSLNTKTPCETHDTYNCTTDCDRPDRSGTAYGDLSSWSHFPGNNPSQLADPILKAAIADCDLMTYAFQYKSHEP